MNDTTFRTVNYPLANILPRNDYKLTEQLFDFLESELHILCDKYLKSGKVYTKKLLKSRGNFRNQVLKDFGNTNKTWTIAGSKAKYYRIVIERLRTILLSQYERQEVAKICAQHSFDRAKIADIRKDLQKAHLYITTGHLNNILASQGSVAFPDSPKMILDYTSEDNETSSVKVVGSGSGSDFIYSFKVYDQWLICDLTLPHFAHKLSGKIARPVVQKDSNGELVLRVSYEVEKPHNENTCGFLGIDLGRNKLFAASVIYNDGSYSTELTMTKELENLGNKIQVLEEIKRNIYKKLVHNERLVTKAQNKDYLERKIADHRRELAHITTKLTNEKEHAGWLVARDIVFHCITHGISVVKMENLRWLESKGGKWNFSFVQEKIHEVCELNGIAVYIVNAKNTSNTDPFENVITTHPSYRLTRTSVGVLDRDYCGSLNVCAREGKKYNKRDKIPSKAPSVSLRKQTRDKHRPTPKRAKGSRKKSTHKQEVKKKASHNNFGCYIAVDTSNKCTDSAIEAGQSLLIKSVSHVLSMHNNC